MYDKYVETLRELINEESNWTRYANNRAIPIIQDLIQTDDIEAVANKNYVTQDEVKTIIASSIYRLRNKDINLRFGPKVDELFFLMEEVEDWERYVGDKTANIAKHVYECQSMDQAIKELKMKYGTIRAHLLRGAERIKNKKTDWKRGGQSEQAQELFTLMDTTPNWEEYVTDNEIELAKKFREVRNFYKLGRILGMAPSNIAGTLYGTTQKVGVIGKIKQRIPQTQRRDIDGRREEYAQAEIEKAKNEQAAAVGL